MQSGFSSYDGILRDSMKGNRISELLESGGIITAPGVFDPLSAILVQNAGFKAAYVSGASSSYTQLGLPDLGFLGMLDLAAQVSRISASVEIPLICDADNGYGNEVNAFQTARMFQRAGADAIQLEDQVSPKRCGHLTGKEVTDPEDMVLKLKAARKAAPDMMLIARTDALTVLGIEEAIGRANLYLEEGADVAFVESPLSIDDLKRIGKEVKGPKLANMVEGGNTPLLTSDELQALGYSIVIYPGACVRASVKAMENVLSELRQNGTTRDFLKNMADFREIQEILGAEDLLRKVDSD